MILLSFIVGCQEAATPVGHGLKPATDPLRVAVTNHVLLEMTQAVCGNLVAVINVMPVATSSRHWEPSGAEARGLQQARLVLISGAGYEPWKDHVSLPGSRVRDTAAGYYDQFIRIPDATIHQHGPEGQHSHPGTVWATWLDPDLAMAQLQQVTNACVRVSPEMKAEFETSAARFKAQLDGLNLLVSELKAIPHPNNFQVIADGPFYQYLTTRLDWPLSYMHWEDDAIELTEQHRLELTDFLADAPKAVHPIFLLSTQRTAAVEEFVSSNQLTVVRIDLCETPANPAAPLVDRLRGNLERLKSAVNQ